MTLDQSRFGALEAAKPYLAGRASHTPRAGICGRALLLAIAIVFGAAAGAFSSFSAPIAGAQMPSPTPTLSTLMRVDPTSQSVSAGTNVVIDVYVDDVTSLGAYEFEITYSPSVLSFISVANGIYLGSTGRTVTCLPPLIDGDSVRFGCVTFAPPPPDGPSGSGLLATVTLGTSCSGASNLDMTVAVLGDTLGSSIPTRSQGGSVTVTGGGS